MLLLDLETNGIAETRHSIHICCHNISITYKSCMRAIFDHPFDEVVEFRFSHSFQGKFEELEQVVLNHALTIFCEIIILSNVNFTRMILNTRRLSNEAGLSLMFFRIWTRKFKKLRRQIEGCINYLLHIFMIFL